MECLDLQPNDAMGDSTTGNTEGIHQADSCHYPEQTPCLVNQPGILRN